MTSMASACRRESFWLRSLGNAKPRCPPPGGLPSFKVTKQNLREAKYISSTVDRYQQHNSTVVEEQELLVQHAGVYAFNIDFKCINGFLCKGMKVVKTGLRQEDKTEVAFRTRKGDKNNRGSLEERVHGDVILFLQSGDKVHLEPLSTSYSNRRKTKKYGLFNTTMNDDTITDIVVQGAMLRCLDW